jgi:hypothetical protein
MLKFIFILIGIIGVSLSGNTLANADMSFGSSGGSSSGDGGTFSLFLAGGYSVLGVAQLSGASENFSGYPLKARGTISFSPHSAFQTLLFAYGEKSSLKSSIGNTMSALMYSGGLEAKYHRFGIFLGGYLGNLNFVNSGTSTAYTSKGFNGGVTYSQPISKRIALTAEFEHLFWNVSGTGSGVYSPTMDGSVERGFFGIEFYF